MSGGIPEIEKARKSYDADPLNADNAMALVEALVKAKNIEEASSIAQQAKRNIPENALTSALFWSTLGDLFYRRKDWEGAKGKYQKAITLSSEDAINLRVKLAKCDIKLGSLETAENALRKLAVAHPGNWIVAECLYVILGQTGKRPDLAVFLDKALKANPSSHILWRLFGSNQYHLGNFDKAKSAYGKSVKLSPKKADKALTGLGLIEKDSGNPLEAEKFFLRSLELQPNNNSALQHYAEMLHEQKRYSEESSLLAKHRSENIKPSAFWLAYAKGKRRDQKWDTGKNTLKAACENGDCPPDVLIVLAKEDVKSGNFDAARELIAERARLSPPTASRLVYHKELYGDIYDDPLRAISSLLNADRTFVFHDCSVVVDNMQTPLEKVENYRRVTVPRIESPTNTVYVFGSSETYGIHNADDQTIASHLQKLFCDTASSVEVVNMAVLGQGIGSQYLRFKKLDIKKNDRVVFLLHTALLRQSRKSARVKRLRTIASECVAKGARFTIFSLPTAGDVMNPSPREKIILAGKYGEKLDRQAVSEYKKEFVRSASKFGLEYYSLSGLSNRPHDMGEVYFDTFHFNHRLNRRIAEKIFTIINSSAPSIPLVPVPEEIRSYTIRTAIKYMSAKSLEKYGPDLSIKNWIESVRNPDFTKAATVGAIVMNCNPFTWGHHYLIEQAAKQVDGLYIFVLEEDKSFFPYADRIQLVRKGTAAFGNKISVHPSGKFIISSLSFPGYFSKERAIEPADSTTDVLIFGSVIAPALNITHRFVGEEPNCLVTNSYNETMKFLLPNMGVDIHVIPRKMEGGQVISASIVRKALQEKHWEIIRQIVPPTTYDYLVARFGQNSAV